MKLCVYVVTVCHFHGDFHLFHTLLAPHSHVMASNQKSCFNVIEPGVGGGGEEPGLESVLV